MDINDTLVYLGYLCGCWGLGWCAGYASVDAEEDVRADLIRAFAPGAKFFFGSE